MVMQDVIADFVANFDMVMFVVMATVTLVLAIMTLESENLTHAIIYLALTFAGVGVMYIILSAEYIAMIQMTVYTGGVIVLFLFALMLTRSEEFMIRGSFNRKMTLLFVALLVSLFTSMVLPLTGLIKTFDVSSVTSLDVDPLRDIANFPHGIAWVGFSLFNFYQIAFLILGLIVVTILVGAIYLVKTEVGEDMRIVKDFTVDDAWMVEPELEDD